MRFETTAEGGSLRWLCDYQRVLLNAFVDIEITGFPFSPVTHREFITRAEAIHQKYQRRLRADPDFIRHCKHMDVNPDDFKFNSPKQLSQFFFASPPLGLGLDPVKESKTTGNPSTDRQSLEVFAERDVDFASDLLVLRNFEKLLGSFGEPLLKLYNRSTGAIHPTYFLAKVIDGTGRAGGTHTGRLSCKLPNMQQIPKRDKDKKGIGLAGVDVRKAFGAKRGHILVEADQSQVEVRVAGMYAQDEQMGEFFKQGGDFHTRVAAMVAGVDYDGLYEAVDDVNHPDHSDAKQLRSSAKTITFGLLYGMGIPKLIRQCKMDEDEGQDFIDTYFSIFPDLAEWRDQMIDYAIKYGRVVTLFGRERQIVVEGFKSADKREERIGINTPIQSAAADITLYGLARIWERLVVEGWETCILGTVHDSIILSVPPDEFNQVMPWIVEDMVRPPGLDWLLDDVPIPLSVGVDAGPNFRDMAELNLDQVAGGQVDVNALVR